MLRIRFQRQGKKNRPFFKVVLAEKKAPPRGKFLEVLGYFDPLTKQSGLKEERIKYWLGQGVQASDSLYNFLVNAKILKGPKIKIPIPKKKKEEKPAPGTEVVAEKKEEKLEEKQAEKEPKKMQEEKTKEKSKEQILVKKKTEGKIEEKPLTQKS